jgi:hypothetical protein
VNAHSAYSQLALTGHSISLFSVFFHLFASLSDRTGNPQLLPDVFPSGLLPDPRVALVRDVAAMGNILGVEVFHSRVSTSASMDVIKKPCFHMSYVFFMCSIDLFCLRNADCPTKHASNLTFGCTMCFLDARTHR